MPVTCGIDLGTTYSAISWYDPFGNRVDTVDLDTSDGEKLLRSVVYFPGQDAQPVVGETAYHAERQYPDRVVKAIKRSMGTAYKTAPVDGVEYTPEQISARILEVLVADAEAFFGEPVGKAIITVPAYFGDNERAATREAAKLANVPGADDPDLLLPEPHAAALAYSVDKVADIVDKHLLVYDLGGGTFDITLIHAAHVDSSEGVSLKIDTLCKDGDAHLGGLDWDRALAELVAERVMQEHGVDVWENPLNEPILLDNCEKAKRHLARSPEATILADVDNHQVTVSVSDFEDRTRDLLLRSQAMMEGVMDEAESKHGIARDQIQVMLAGGSTQMPMVRKMIESVTGKPPLRHKNPNLLVTVGAAYWAHLLNGGKVVVPVPDPDTGETVSKEVTVGGGLEDISTYPVGIEVFRKDEQGNYVKRNSVVVPTGAKYAQRFEKEFATSDDGMTEIDVILYKGESEDLDECKQLANFTITGLPEGRPKGQRVAVKLGYDESGILTGEAVDISSGQKVDIQWDRSHQVASPIE